MNKTMDTRNSGGDAIHLPLEPLFTLLHKNGFQVKPDDYIEMLKITERFGSGNIDETAKWICPIIATSETEQVKFYNVVEEYKKLSQTQGGIARPPVNTIWKRIAIPSLLLALAIAAVFYFSRPTPVPLLQGTTNQNIVVEKGITQLSAAGLFTGRQADTSLVKVIWQFNDGSTTTGINVNHTFDKPGKEMVTRSFESAKLPLAKKQDSVFVTVCNDTLTPHIQRPAEPAIINTALNFTVEVTAPRGFIKEYVWQIGDSSYTTSLPVLKNISLSKQGEYTIICNIITTDTNALCIPKDVMVFQVSGSQNYQASIDYTNTEVTPPFTGLKGWIHASLLLPAIGCVLYALTRRKKPAPPLRKEPARAGTDKKPGRQPYEIPFERNDIKLVQSERDLRRTLVQMRYKAEEENLVLNVPGTISSIIRAGGSPQLVYAPLTRQQEYLLLIDRSNAKSMMLHFFEHLAGVMTENAIPVTCFYYDKDFVCYNNQHPSGTSLQRLAEICNGHTLIIMGTAHELVYRAYPVIEEKFLKELNRWEQKAIITPTPAVDWGAKEKVLQEYMILLPADATALQKLLPSIREKIKLKKNQLVLAEANPYSTLYVDFRNVEELKKYLNDDEVLFQWLCAVCVYPRLRWEVLIGTGKAVLDKYGQPEKLNYTNLLRLCRISWMRDGVFPQATRLELLKQLTTDNELCARETMLRMLNYSSLLYKGEGYFFEEEKQRQQLTNEFILYSSDNNKYKSFEGSSDTFKKLWKNNSILDAPLKIYLEKKDGNWETPVTQKHHSVSLSDYFNEEEVKADRPQRFSRIMSFAAAALLTGVWIWLVAGGPNRAFAEKYLYRTPPDVSFNVNVNKSFNNCGDTSKHFDDLKGGILAGGTQVYVTKYNKTNGTLSATIPYGVYHSGPPMLNIDWGGNAVSLPIVLGDSAGRLPSSITITCADLNTTAAAKLPLYIRYNNDGAYNQIATTLSDALSRYDISALQTDFTDPSRIIYYNDNQKARADSIAQIVQQSLGITVKEEFIKEDRTPPPVPMLFLNLSTPNKPVLWTQISRSALPASLNEIWTNSRGNKLMNIKTWGPLVWYSEAGKNKYESYGIAAAYRNSNDAYKIVVLINSNTYKAFVVRNLRSGSFDLATCPGTATNMQELVDKSDTACGNYERMSLYYERNPAVIYLPLTATDLAPSEKTKMDRKADTLNNMSKSQDFKMSLYSNDTYAETTTEKLKPFLTKSKIKFSVSRNNSLLNTTLATINPANPFSRSYVVITFESTPTGNYNNPPVNQAPEPDCKTTFYSIAEIKKLSSPLVVCKLDLSKENLKSLPQELNEFINMQELTLGQTSIPEASIRNLQSQLPKCKIIYTIPPPKDTSLTLAREISLRSTGKLASQDISYIQSLVKVLMTNRDARVRLVALTNNDVSQSDARSNLAAIRNYLQVSSSQVSEQLLPQTGNYKPQKISYEVFPFKPTAGTGPSADEDGVPPAVVLVYLYGFPASYFAKTDPTKSKY